MRGPALHTSPDGLFAAVVTLTTDSHGTEQDTVLDRRLRRHAKPRGRQPTGAPSRLLPRSAPSKPRWLLILDDGWVWHPLGVPTVIDAAAWLSGHVHARGGRHGTVGVLAHAWDQPVAWLDEDIIAIQRIGHDDEQMLAVQLFDVPLGHPTRSLAHLAEWAHGGGALCCGHGGYRDLGPLRSAPASASSRALPDGARRLHRHDGGIRQRRLQNVDASDEALNLSIPHRTGTQRALAGVTTGSDAAPRRSRWDLRPGRVRRAARWLRRRTVRCASRLYPTGGEVRRRTPRRARSGSAMPHPASREARRHGRRPSAFPWPPDSPRPRSSAPRG